MRTPPPRIEREFVPDHEAIIAAVRLVLTRAGEREATNETPPAEEQSTGGMSTRKQRVGADNGFYPKRT